MEPGIKHPRFTTLVGLILVVAALYLAKEVLVLVAIAALLAFLLAPLVSKVQRLRLKRLPAVVIVLFCAFVLVGGIGWIVFGEIGTLIDKLPEYKHNLRHRFDDLTSTIRSPLEKAE